MAGVSSVIAAASKTTTTSAAAAAAAAASSSATKAINLSAAAAVATASGNGIWAGPNSGLGAIFSTRGGAIAGPSDADAAAGVPFLFDRQTDDSPSKPTLMTAVAPGGAGSEQKFARNKQKRRMPLSHTLSRFAARWGAMPQAFRYGTAVAVGNLLFFTIDKMLWHHFMIPHGTDWLPPVLHSRKETVNFFFAYLIEIWVQHLLNAALVYGLDTIATRSKYTSTLMGTYGAYSAALVGSTFMNAALVTRLGKDLAFVTTLLVFGMVNYFVLTWIMVASPQGKPAPRKPSDAALPKLGTDHPQRGGAVQEEPSVNSFRRTNSGAAIHRKQYHASASLEVPMASEDANTVDVSRKEDNDDEDDDVVDGVDARLLRPSHNGARLRRVRTGGSTAVDVDANQPTAVTAATATKTEAARPAVYRRRASGPGPQPRKRTESNMHDNDDDAVVEGVSVDPGSDATLMHLAMSGDAGKVNKQ